MQRKEQQNFTNRSHTGTSANPLQQRTRARLLELSQEKRLDPARASAALAAAYQAVTRDGVLSEVAAAAGAAVAGAAGVHASD
jgi:hypothetical protein